MKKQLFSFISSFILFVLMANPIFGKTVADFDGDGKTDLVITRLDPSRNNQLYWFTLNSRDNSFTAMQWGGRIVPDEFAQDDIHLLEDFDGDGKTDIGVFRKRYVYPPAPTYFYILRSSDGTMQAIQWGNSDDDEISQDYDGDGKADIAVARNTGGGLVWFILGSRAGYYIEFVSGRFNVPIKGDYDGDGKADIAAVRTNEFLQQYFYIKRSSTGQESITQFGNGRIDYVVPGDYDGDKKTDIAVWRGKGETHAGMWYWIRSSDGNWGSVQLGTGTQIYDYPVPGDYDGDGTTDPAIYRRGYDYNPSLLSYFYVIGSKQGFFIAPWGLGTDATPIYHANVFVK